MENSPFDEQIKSLLKEIMLKPFSYTSSVVEAEQNFKELYHQNPTSPSVLIALLFCNLVLGKRDIAFGLSQKIWSQGGELSDFFELVYTDCLLNFGETAKAYDLLAPRLQNPRENLDYFYMVMIKYTLLKPDLFLLMKLGEYPHVYDAEPALFDFAKKHALSITSQVYSDLLKSVLSLVGDTLCAFEYYLYDDGIELLFYTNVSAEQNEEWTNNLSSQAEAYFEEHNTEEMNDLSIQLLPINKHSAWLE